MNELLPCPFCGSEAELNGPSSSGSWVECTNSDCGAAGGYDFVWTSAIKKWNTRATPPYYDACVNDLMQVIESQREEIAQLKAREQAHGERPE